MYDAPTVAEVLTLASAGLTDSQIARRAGVSRQTVGAWRHGRVPIRRSRLCDLCAGRTPRFPAADYAYLLGIYLGDGCISQHRRTFRIRIVLDVAYSEIIKSTAASLEALCPAKRAWIGSHGQGCVEVSMYWNHWPCLFPQHGPGRKHLRPITLAPWQRLLVERNRRELIKGLIHSDGCRVVANDRGVPSVRYHFSNLSEDIKGVYCENLDALGIPWTRPSAKHIAVYRKSAVLIMDEFVGPKR